MTFNPSFKFAKEKAKQNRQDFFLKITIGVESIKKETKQT
jgi:hypothetical protein